MQWTRTIRNWKTWIPPPFPIRSRMALIMYVLHKLFGAEESEMQEAFSESFHTPEEKKADERRIQAIARRSAQPIAQMEESISPAK